MGTSCSSLPAPARPLLSRKPSAAGANAATPLLDCDTHELRSKNSVAYEFIPAKTAALGKPSGSPTRRPLIVPSRDALQRPKPAQHQRSIPGGGVKAWEDVAAAKRPTHLVLKSGTHMRYSDLVLGMPLGAGTYGEVSAGLWGGRRVAVKKLFPGTTPVETEEVYTDFLREIGILRRIRHDRIVSFLGFVEERASPFCLVFELLEGNVATLLKSVRRGEVNVTFRVCLGIARDAAEAVHYLHKQRPAILHRDLKAENLLLERNFRCKLTDFGLSRAFDAGRPSKMTVCGTPSWVAPEVFRGDEYCEKVDVYSFGVLLWEIFAGRKPYGDKSSADLPYLVGTQGLRPPALQHVPRQLNELMAACWTEVPADRPSFGMVRQRLDAATQSVTDARRLGSAVHGDNLKLAWTSAAVLGARGGQEDAHRKHQQQPLAEQGRSRPRADRPTAALQLV